MESLTTLPAGEQADMLLPKGQDLVHDDTVTRTPDQWIEQAAFCLHEAKKAACPDMTPLPWDLEPRAVRGDFRFLAMASHRRSLPLVRECLIELTASNLANLDGWQYPGCDNKHLPEETDSERAARAAQRRQSYRHKAREILSAAFRYLEVDCDTEAQRKITVERAEGQRLADSSVVSFYRQSRGIPTEVNRG